MIFLPKCSAFYVVLEKGHGAGKIGHGAGKKGMALGKEGMARRHAKLARGNTRVTIKKSTTTEPPP